MPTYRITVCTETHSTYLIEADTADAAVQAYEGDDDAVPVTKTVRACSVIGVSAVHDNGAPMFAPDGMMLDKDGNRSIFDDVDA
jgi:sugar lactone lactonase YvrE